MTPSTRFRTPHLRERIALGTGLIFVLFLNGAVPFVSMPTLGQAVFLMGLSQSLANSGPLSLYATNVGIPEPVALAIGFAVAFPASFFLAFGLHPADAYSLIVAFWLALAYFGAWRFGILLGLKKPLGVLTAMLWMSTPVIWSHANYSALSLGIALLPFYFWTALRLYLLPASNRIEAVRGVALFVAACLIAIFMDGYSFVMFAVGCVLLGTYSYFKLEAVRRLLRNFVLPTYVAGWGLAYLLFSTYIGKPHYDPEPLEFFRGWGVDLIFLAVPTNGVLWIWDQLQLSASRMDREFFGDASVWTTTFAVPIIAAGLWAWWRTKVRLPLATGFLIVAAFGLYMALGPSLKINSKRPAEMFEAGDMRRNMPAELAIAPTGSAFLSQYVPGFQNMRASYRWWALSAFGLWTLLVIATADFKFRTSRLWMMPLVLILLLILSNLPPPRSKWNEYRSYRDAFLRIDDELLGDMARSLRHGERVAFLPYGNDFLVNYLASRIDFRSYNVGGDKHLFEARNHWPATMRGFQMSRVDSGFSDRIILLLSRGEADAVILPYIDLLWAAHYWPPEPVLREVLGTEVEQLQSSNRVDLVERTHFVVVRLSEGLETDSNLTPRAESKAFENCVEPHCLQRVGADLASLPRQVGQARSGKLMTDGRKGFLLFGPYTYLKSGDYRLQLFGSASVVKSAWVDVASMKGAVQHVRFPLHTPTSASENVLAEGEVSLRDDVSDLEVRVFVEELDQITIEAYRLQLLFE